jgi:hypothetical protein
VHLKTPHEELVNVGKELHCWSRESPLCFFLCGASPTALVEGEELDSRGDERGGEAVIGVAVVRETMEEKNLRDRGTGRLRGGC